MNHDAQVNFLLPRRRTDNLSGGVDDWKDLLAAHKLGGVRTSTKPRPMTTDKRNAGMKQLAQLVASKLKLDISRNKKMANVDSANAYIQSRQQKVAGKFQKDGVTPRKSGFEGWIASNQFDIDGDDVNDNIVYEGTTPDGRPKNLKYVEGYNVGGRNQAAYGLLQSYLSGNSSAASRKALPYNSYLAGLRRTENVETFMDLWKDIFGDYLANGEQYEGAAALSDSSKMIQNRVRTYLYRLFLIYLCREVGVIGNEDSFADAIEKIKRVSKSGRARDTILNKVYEDFAVENKKQNFEAVLFAFIDKKVNTLIKLLVGEYQRGEKINPDEVTQLLFSVE
jgi:hypothetical protein